jgi:hypothetical protein
VVVGDFTGDGKQDLAVVDTGIYGGSFGVRILLGNGDGTFQPPVSYVAGPSPWDVAVGDFTGDGKEDLAVVNNQIPGGTVSILLGTAMVLSRPPWPTRSVTTPSRWRSPTSTATAFPTSQSAISTTVR